LALVGFLLLLTRPSPVTASSATETPPAIELSEGEPAQKKSLGHRLLFYIPNRLLDLIDMVRLRGRVGPGIALNIRATDHLSFYVGRYHSVYVGLPGPRHPEKWRSPAGLEEWRGIYFFGVDATDDTENGPAYAPAEFNVGAQVLVLGIDAGFDPVELGDFLSGLILRDPVGDDL
jgi:hypothetical protein